MNELHLFAGAGGGILGGMLLGHTCVCAVEIEEYPRKVLLQRQRDGILPRFPIWDDVSTFDGRPWRGRVDVVCGGFPCQDVSIAGRGAGLSGQRSGLWGEMARIIGEVMPQLVFVENSPMLTVRGLGGVLMSLAEMGYDARWGVLGGSSVGNVAEGERLWILAHEANCIRREALSFQTEIIAGAEREASRRQLERAVSATMQESEHAELWGNLDDVAECVDRLTAIGNGQVPQVAALAWKILKGESS